jgi:hypothetical protein
MAGASLARPEIVNGMSTGRYDASLNGLQFCYPFHAPRTALLLRCGRSELEAQRWLFTCHDAPRNR